MLNIATPPRNVNEKSVSLAPPWLSRSQRRRVEKAIRKLLRQGRCSFCGEPLTDTNAVGHDKHGTVAVAGECCVGQLKEVWGMGLTVPLAPTEAQVRDFGERYGGVPAAHAEIVYTDHPWKNDDRVWFEQNPGRSHRARAPFPDELGGQKIPAGCRVIILVRQVAPGARMRITVDQSTDFPAPPDDEATVHALFDMQTQRRLGKPGSDAELDALIKKYSTMRAQ